MAVSLAKLGRTVWPRFLINSRSTCLTTPTVLSAKSKNILQYPTKRLCYSVPRPKAKSETIKLTLSMPNGKNFDLTAKVGDNLLDVILENDVDIDGFGACEGTLACSTCHLIFKPADFKLLPEKATDEELDMLDLAYDLHDTSRLGCQVMVTKAMEGWVIRVPSGVADARDV